MIADSAYIVRIFRHCVQNNYSVYQGNKQAKAVRISEHDAK